MKTKINRSMLNKLNNTESKKNISWETVVQNLTRKEKSIKEALLKMQRFDNKAAVLASQYRVN